jgi:hypothetical protein
LKQIIINDKENELYLHDPKTGEKIYLFTLWIDNNDISVFSDKGDIWEKINNKFIEREINK